MKIHNVRALMHYLNEKNFGILDFTLKSKSLINQKPDDNVGNRMILDYIDTLIFMT